MFLKVIKFFKCLPDLRILYSFKYSGILSDYGWWESYKRGLPIDKQGNPIPWVTYPFIEFIEGRLKNNLEVFEYGSGNSTFWYAKRVKYVTSVEHDRDWYEKIKSNLPENVSLFYKELVYGGDYSRFILFQNKKFNIVSIDGRDRVNCIIHSINAITEDGIIILDDSERKKYEEGITFLIKNGFRKIDFWGFSPGYFNRKCTSIFYKNNNCLKI